MDSAEVVIDANLLSEIPLFQRPLTVGPAGNPRLTHGYRIDIENESAEDEIYFMKVSFGDYGRESFRGGFESTSEIYAVVGDLIPKPIAWGSFKGLSNAHYYVCEYFELDPEVPGPQKFPGRIADLHKNSVSPNGKFGFHVVTYNGNLPQYNSYTDTWEEFFTRGFQHMLNLSVERGGPWQEMEALRLPMLSKVIPRLLRPMETGGRSIKPSLVHGNLWCGNTGFVRRTERFLIYDPASFYAHNEYELGNWKPTRNLFGSRYIEKYKACYNPAEPSKDFHDRIALYSIRFNLHAAALYPGDGAYRIMVTDEMERLVAKYPGGYEEYEEKDEQE